MLISVISKSYLMPCLLHLKARLASTGGALRERRRGSIKAIALLKPLTSAGDHSLLVHFTSVTEKRNRFIRVTCCYSVLREREKWQGQMEKKLFLEGRLLFFPLPWPHLSPCQQWAQTLGLLGESQNFNVGSCFWIYKGIQKAYQVK